MAEHPHRYSTTSAYSPTSPPAEPSCSSSSHPTISLENRGKVYLEPSSIIIVCCKGQNATGPIFNGCLARDVLVVKSAVAKSNFTAVTREQEQPTPRPGRGNLWRNSPESTAFLGVCIYWLDFARPPIHIPGSAIKLWPGWTGP